MNLFFFIAAVLFGKALTPIHDVPLATFQITASNDIIKIDITFDLEDLAKSMDIKSTEVNFETVQSYLIEHTSFQFNAQVANLNISEVKIVRDHIKVKGDFGKSGMMVKSIKIENSCLNNIPHHSNVMQIDLNNTSKDFRMHKKRTVIHLNY